MNYQADVNVLSSPILKIEKNIIEMDDAIIQIKNVASVSLRYPPKYGYSPYAIGIFIISFYIFFYTVTAAEIKFISFMFLISAAIGKKIRILGKILLYLQEVDLVSGSIAKTMISL